MPYCAEADLLLGEIPLPEYLSATQYINNTAEEIDVALSGLYSTPIEVIDIPQNKPTTLFLKQVNAKLATGRLIMAAAMGHQETDVNAYGKYLIDEAVAALYRVCEKEFVLPGAEQNVAAASDTGGVRIKNLDSVSQVEGFYDQIQVPQEVIIARQQYPGILGGYPYGYSW